MKVDLSIKDSAKKKKADDGIDIICELLSKIMSVYRRSTEEQKAYLRNHNPILDKIIAAIGGIE